MKYRDLIIIKQRFHNNLKQPNQFKSAVRKGTENRITER